jgi:hypothetical protein
MLSTFVIFYYTSRLDKYQTPNGRNILLFGKIVNHHDLYTRIRMFSSMGAFYFFGSLGADGLLLRVTTNFFAPDESRDE